MSPAYDTHLLRRGLSSTNAFSLTFALIAFVVLTACFTWACVWPQVRKRYVNDRYPSRTRFTDEVNLTQRRPSHRSTRMFPSHPAIPRGHKKATTTTHLRTYNPRVETPFPSHPGSGLVTGFSSETPKPRYLAQPSSVPTSHGLFTPAKDQAVMKREWLHDKSLTVPRTRTELEKVKSALTDKDFGDAKEYILTIPEPLMLRAREAGKPPAPVKSMEKLSIAGSNSSADKHLHPNKLFQVLDRQSQHISQCSSTTLKIQSSEPSGVSRSIDGNFTEHPRPSLSVQLSEASLVQPDVKSIMTMNSSASGTDVTDTEDGMHNPSLAAIQRLKTYRSLTGAQPVRPLTRAGTLTRPKTPVADISRRFNESAVEDHLQPTPFHGGETSATEPLTAPNSSNKGLPSSAATSTGFMASSLSLLPTPLTIRTPCFDEDELPSIKRETEISIADSATSKTKAFKKSLHSLDVSRGSVRRNTFSKSNIPRPRPAPLNIASAVRVLKQRDSALRAMPSFTSMNVPLMRRKSFQGGGPRVSSVYSRDTRGFSVAQTPISLQYTSSPGRTPVSPFCPNIGETDLDSKAGPPNEYYNLSSPADMAKTKIDNWKCHVDDLEVNATAYIEASSSKSPLNQRYKSVNRASRATEAASAISTEIHSIEAQTSHPSMPRIFNADASGDPDQQTIYSPEMFVPTSRIIRQMTSDSALVVATRGHAPGGAGWV